MHTCLSGPNRGFCLQNSPLVPANLLMSHQWQAGLSGCEEAPRTGRYSAKGHLGPTQVNNLKTGFIMTGRPLGPPYHLVHFLHSKLGTLLVSAF